MLAGKEIRLAAGATELERSAYAPDTAQYVRYIRRKKEDKHSKKAPDKPAP